LSGQRIPSRRQPVSNQADRTQAEVKGGKYDLHILGKTKRKHLKNI